MNVSSKAVGQFLKIDQRNLCVAQGFYGQAVGMARGSGKSEK
jgi:hypothetical protein